MEFWQRYAAAMLLINHPATSPSSLAKGIALVDAAYSAGRRCLHNRQHLV